MDEPNPPEEPKDIGKKFIVFVAAVGILLVLLAAVFDSLRTKRQPPYSGPWPSTADRGITVTMESDSGSGVRVSPPEPPPFKATTEGVTPSLESRVAALKVVEVVTRVDLEASPVTIYVGRKFYDLTFHERQAAIKDINDYIAIQNGKPGGALYMDVVDGMSGRKLYDWELYKLKPR